MNRGEELCVLYFDDTGVNGAKAAALSASKSPMVAVIDNFIVSAAIENCDNVPMFTMRTRKTADSIRTGTNDRAGCSCLYG